MTMTDTKEFAETFARKVLEQAWQFRQEGEVVPMWFAIGPSGPHIIATPYDGYDEKRVAGHLVAEEVRKVHATSVISVADAWMRTVDVKGLSQEQAEAVIDAGPLPSEAPDRVEALFVTIWHADGTAKMLTRQYGSDCAGSLVILREDETDDEDRVATYTFSEVVDALREQAGG